MPVTIKFKMHAEKLLGAETVKNLEAQAALEAENYLKLNQSISSTLQEYMQKNNFGFNDVSKEFGLSPTQVNKLLKGQGNFTLSTVAHVYSQMGKKLVLVSV